jgi:hypothetical protein
MGWGARMNVHVPRGVAQTEFELDENEPKIGVAAVAERPAKPNWDRIKADYEAGAVPIREIARREGVSDTAIAKRAKAHGWNGGLRSGANQGANQFAAPVQTSVQTEPQPDRGLEFDWRRCRDDIVVPSQPAIAVYTNPDGAVVLRQEGHYGPEEDHWVFVHRQNLHALIQRLQQLEDEGPVE